MIVMMRETDRARDGVMHCGCSSVANLEVLEEGELETCTVFSLANSSFLFPGVVAVAPGA